LEADDLAALADGESGQKDRHNAILPERQSIVGMSRNLKDELSIPPFEHELTMRWTFDRQTAEDEWSGIEADILSAGFPPEDYLLDGVGLF